MHMLKTYTWTGLLLGVLVVTGLLHTQYAEATSDDPPFQVVFDANTSTSTITIENGEEYPIVGIEGSLGISGLSPSFSASSSELYKQQDGDNLLVAQGTKINPVLHSIGPVTLVAGTYLLHVTEGSPPSSVQTIPQKIFAYIVQTAHAAAGDTTIITFTVTEPVAEDAGEEDGADAEEDEETEESSSSSRSRSTYGTRIPETITQAQVGQITHLVGVVTILSGRKEETSEQQRVRISSVLAELLKFLKGM